MGKTAKSAVFLLVFLSPCLFAAAQTTPFLTEGEYRALVNEISGDTAFEHIRWMSHYHRPAGSKGFEAVLRYTCDKAKEYGLEDVRIIRQASERPSWTASKAELWMVEPQEVKLTSPDQVAVSLADYSRNTDVVAELVDVGHGESDADYEGKEVKGKIVLTDGANDVVMEKAVWQRGALGIVSYATNRENPLDHLDQVAWQGIPAKSKDGKLGTFGFVLSPRRGMWLKEMLQKSKAPLKLKAVVASEFVEPSWQAMCEGFIKGTTYSDQDIVFTAHLQEEKESANDDGSGSAALLEMARSLNRLIHEGKIKRPRRSLRFWWTTENSSERQFFSDFPGEKNKLLVDINLDMVGANQTMGNRVQHVTRTPFSRPSFLSDVTENIVDFVRTGNTAYYASVRAGKPYPFTKPILAQTGTHDRYNVLVVPFFNGSDHQQFNEAVIGVPAVAFINWPDEFIHSTDDELWNIDPTQLQRNAFVATAIGYAIATADDASLPTWAAEIYGNALSRIGRELKLALQWLAIGPKSDLPRIHRTAANQLHQAVEREIQTLLSVNVFAEKDGSGAKLMVKMTEQLIGQERMWRGEIDRLYEAVAGAPPPPLLLSEKEKQLAKKVPVLISSPKEFYAAKAKIKPVPDLHIWMAYEALLLVNGVNSYLDIFNALSAEALSAGDFYYGKVTPEMVEQYLDNAVAAGAIRMKE